LHKQTITKQNTSIMRKKKTEPIISDMKSIMSDIQNSVSWGDIASRYFHKSSSWLYHKMDGIDGNGGIGGFNQEEAAKLKEALYDLSKRINVCADKIPSLFVVTDPEIASQTQANLSAKRRLEELQEMEKELNNRKKA